MNSWGSARLQTISSHKNNKFVFLEIVIPNGNHWPTDLGLWLVHGHISNACSTENYMVIFPMHVLRKTNNIDTCFAMHALEHASKIWRWTTSVQIKRSYMCMFISCICGWGKRKEWAGKSHKTIVLTASKYTVSIVLNVDTQARMYLSPRSAKYYFLLANKLIFITNVGLIVKYYTKQHFRNQCTWVKSSLWAIKGIFLKFSQCWHQK